MIKNVLKTWTNMQKAQWKNGAWIAVISVHLSCMAVPVFFFPAQVIITSAWKALLSPFPPLAEWTVRNFSVYSDEVFLIACADCGRIIFLLCFITAFIEFFIAFLRTYLLTM